MQDYEGYAEQIKCADCGEPIEPGDDFIVSSGEFYCNDCCIKCVNCGEKIPRCESYETEDGKVCEGCRYSGYEECYHCGEIVHINQINYIERDDRHVCNYCLKNRYRCCDDCGEYVYDDDTYYTSDDRIVCQDCYDDHYFTCENCDRIYHTDDLVNIDGSYYCSSCAEEIEHKKIYDYHSFNNYYPRRMDTEPNENLYFGVELECEKGNFNFDEFDDWTGNGELVHFEHDGSLNSGGVECITQPCTLRYHQTKMDWDDLCQTLLDQGYRSAFGGSNCGLHIHFSRSAVSPLTIIKTDVFVNRAHKFFSQIARRNVFFNTNYDSLKMADKDKGRYISGCDHDERYTAVNTTNRKTVEIRIFKGTLKSETILGTIELVHGMLKFLEFVPIVEIYLTWKNVMDFVNYLYDNHQKYPHVFPMMKRLIKEDLTLKNKIYDYCEKIDKEKN